MTNVSVFCSVIPERHHLLLRSMDTWLNSGIKAGVNFSMYVYAEGYPTDYAEGYRFNRYENINYSPHRTGSPEVGSNFLWNKYKDQTDVAIFTHPEIMFGEDVVLQAVLSAQDKTYVTFRPFWMPKYLTEHWDEYHFEHTQDCEDCNEMYQYGPDPDGPKRYLNLNIRERYDWESDTTWAGNKASLNDIFPVPEFGFWGPIDAWLAGARRGYGHKTVVPEACIYHQDHPRIEGKGPGEAVNAASTELIKRFGHMV